MSFLALLERTSIAYYGTLEVKSMIMQLNKRTIVYVADA